MLIRDLVDLWIQGKARKVEIDEEGAQINYGGTLFYLTGEQIGQAFAELDRTENDLEMFLIKQCGWQGREEAVIDRLGSAELSPELGFPFVAVIALIGAGITGYSEVQKAKEQRKAAEKAAAATRTGIVGKVKELASLQSLALIGAVAAVGVAVVMSRRKRKS